MKTFEVTLTTHVQVLMEARDEADARACMKIRCGAEIVNANDYEIEAVEVTVKPEDRHRVLVA